MRTEKSDKSGFYTNYYLTYEDFFGSSAVMRTCGICSAKQYRNKSGTKPFGGPQRMKLVCQNKRCRVKFI